MPDAQVRKIIILGGGFAGARAAEVLATQAGRQRVTLIDKKTSSDFLPLLPDTIGRGIDPRRLRYRLAGLSKKAGCTYVQAEVSAVSFEPKEVVTSVGRYEYEYLLVASGSETNFYGNANIRDNAYKLDEVADVLTLRKALEEKRPGAFIIGGGGYTGIEVATNLRVFLDGHKRKARIIIVERAPAILGPLPEWMKQYAGDNLKRLGIEVLVASGIEKIEGARVLLAGGQAIDNALVIWAAGVRTADFIQDLKVEKNPQGRIKVDEFLRVNPYCFVAGDAALFSFQNAFLRMSVQYALMQGACAAENIARSIKGLPLKAFLPQDPGYIVPMANNRSCGIVFGRKIRGAVATLLHFFMCIFRSRGMVNQQGIIDDLLTGEGAMVDLGLLAARLGLGIMFMAHGAQKALGLFGGPGIKGFAGFLAALGFGHPTAWAYLAAYTELIGGLLVVVGLGTRAASTMLLIVMAVAMAKVHLSKGFFMATGGFEYTFVIASLCIALILAGPGKFSINKKL